MEIVSPPILIRILIGNEFDYNHLSTGIKDIFSLFVCSIFGVGLRGLRLALSRTSFMLDGKLLCTLDTKFGSTYPLLASVS